MNKNDCKILCILYQEGCFSPLESMTASDVSKISELGGTKIRKTLNDFKKLSYVNEGLKKAQARTFYITEEGIEFLKEILSPNTLDSLME